MIKTERLFIRSLLPEDWRSMQRIAIDFCKSQYVIYDMPLPTEDRKIKALVQSFAESEMFFSVMLDGVMIGYICFHAENENYDLGFCFHSDYQGRGYAYESCAAMMEYMKQDRNVTAFTAGTALKNTPSRKLLEKLGFVLVETEQLSFHKDENGNDIIFEGGNFIKTTETKCSDAEL